MYTVKTCQRRGRSLSSSAGRRSIHFDRGRSILTEVAQHFNCKTNALTASRRPIDRRFEPHRRPFRPLAGKRAHFRPPSTVFVSRGGGCL
jgi:hypothetical protein